MVVLKSFKCSSPPQLVEKRSIFNPHSCGKETTLGDLAICSRCYKGRNPGKQQWDGCICEFTGELTI